MTKEHNASISIRAQVSDLARTETLYGREFMVVPVIALVEGVLQGMNASTPELALEEEFGKVPDGWNGRPLVMNHPVVNGSPVSANSPKILEEYAFGQLFNTAVEDGKLKTEAWIDVERVNALGGEVATTLDRINANQSVEVSTGLYTSVEEVQGKFNGKDYSGIWRNIVPDHLAFLSEGVLGACSIEDGCGTPRINTSKAAVWTEYKMPKDLKTAKTSEGDCGCGCGGTGTCSQPHVHEASNAVPEEIYSRLLNNSYPADMVSSDVRTLLKNAMTNLMPQRDYYIMAFTQDHVIYEVYDSATGMYKNKRRSYTISVDKSVVLGDTEENVLVLTDIVLDNGQSPTPKMNFNREGDEMTDKTTNADGTPKVAAQAAATQPLVLQDPIDPAAALAADLTKPTVTPTVTPAAPAVQAAPKVRTMGEYLNDLPAEMREVMESGLKLHNQRKDALITGLKASNRCNFSDEQLKAMNLDMLENLATLASVPTYEGGSPRPTLVDNADETTAPTPPALFAKKSA